MICIYIYIHIIDYTYFKGIVFCTIHTSAPAIFLRRPWSLYRSFCWPRRASCLGQEPVVFTSRTPIAGWSIVKNPLING